MAKEAKKDFPEVDFKKSIMVGDSPVDMEFGKRMGMRNVYVGEEIPPGARVDNRVSTLTEFANFYL